jgi:hypothetical protein
MATGSYPKETRETMKNVIREHFADLNGEVYKMKFKDKPGRSAVRISLNEMPVSKLEIIKDPGENNSFTLRLIK